MMRHWQIWALGSAVFAAATAVLAKIGVAGVDSDFATFVRTLVVVAVLVVLLQATGHWQAPGSLSMRSYVFLICSGVATGLSWLCYFKALQLGRAAAVAPVDKLSVVLVALFGTMFLGERLSFVAWIGVGLIALGAVTVAVAS